MTLAFLISAHTDPEHLRRLILSLPSGSRFHVHIDRKADIAPFVRLLGENPSVTFLEHRTDVVWGSINEVEYQMELLRSALGDSVYPDYLISMSGMDYPLWDNSRMERFFSEAAGREFLQGISMEGQGRHADIYTEYRLFGDRRLAPGSLGSRMRVAARKVLKAVGVKKPLTFRAGGRRYTLYKGAAWWAVTPRLAAAALTAWDTDKVLRHYFSTSFCPAETFLQTFAFSSSEFAPRCILTEGRYTSLAELTPLTYIDYNPVIKILTEEDFPALVASGKMFCRKTVTGRSDRLMDMIDARRDEEDAMTDGADGIEWNVKTQKTL